MSVDPTVTPLAGTLAIEDGSVLGALRSPTRLRIELLAGLAVALALIPEAISFAILAGVDPRVGLFASFTMAVTISIVGGRRAMISAATGAVALVIAPVAEEYGLDYLVATVLLAGVFQITLSLAGATCARALTGQGATGTGLQADRRSVDELVDRDGPRRQYDERTRARDADSVVDGERADPKHGVPSDVRERVTNRR